VSARYPQADKTSSCTTTTSGGTLIVSKDNIKIIMSKEPYIDLHVKIAKSHKKKLVALAKKNKLKLAEQVREVFENLTV